MTSLRQDRIGTAEGLIRAGRAWERQWICTWGLIGLLLGVLAMTGCATSVGGGGGGDAASGEGNAQEPDPPADGGVEREIEEADIIKYEDGYFYLANRYRGLRIIDAITIERPQMVGGLPLTGRGVELYIDEDRAFVVTSADFFTCAGEPVSYKDAELADTVLQPDYDGSRITVVDVSDPAGPFEISHFDMDGFITATRRVGDIIYAAGNFDGPIVTDEGQDQEEDHVGGEADGEQEHDDEPGPAPPSVTGTAREIDEDGTASTFVISPGGVRGGLDVTGADPEGFVQLTVSDGNTAATLKGIPNRAALPLTVTADGDLENGTFTMVVSSQMQFTLVEQAGLDAANLAVYRLDEATGRWTAAATNFVGVREPTGVLGDFGYSIWDNPDLHSVWAVVDSLGDFAVGEAFSDELAVEVIESAGGTLLVDPLQDSYAYGTTITVTAIPDDGFEFLEWSPAPSSAEYPAEGVMQVVLTEDLQIGATYGVLAPTATGPHVFVVSINVADPDDIRVIDRVDVAGDSLDIQVTQNAIYVLGDDPAMSDTTRVTYVDISDPAGAVQERDSFRVPGYLQSRFFADEYDDVFRVVTEDRSLSSGTPVVALYAYDVGDADDVTRIGEVTIEVGETLRSVRFDGQRGYAVTFRQIDPLFVLDLSDPANPLVAGELEVPGWSTHLVPLGERLVGVGFDDTAGFRPAVALYDVSNPARPRQMDRVILGEKWSFDTTSEATVDEKALKVIEDDELILIPVNSYDVDRREYVDSLQLIDLRPTSLQERSFIEHRGLVRRAGMTDQRLWVLSDEAFQVANIDDRDAVISLDTLDIMSEQELLDAGLLGCVDSARLRGFEVEPLFWDDVVFVSYGGGLCGAVGLLGLALISAGALTLHAVRRRR